MAASNEASKLLMGLSIPESAPEEIFAVVDALSIGRSADAAQLLEVSSLEPSALLTRVLSGITDLWNSEVYRACSAFEAVLLEEPDHLIARLGLALCLEVQQDFEAAVDLLRRVLQLDADHVQAIAALARCYNEQGKLDRAEALSRRGLEIKGDALSLRFALADTLRRQSRHEEVVTILGEVWEATDPTLRRAARSDEALAVAYGRSLLALTRSASAAPIFDEVLRRNAESTGAMAGMAEALEQDGRLAEAQGYLLRAMAAAPDQPWLHLLHGRLQSRLGDATAAERSAATALALAPTNVEALRLAMRACREQRRHTDAAPYADRLLALLPLDPEATAARALSRILDGEAAAVISELTSRATGDKGAADLHLALGCAEFAMGRPKEAADHLTQVLRLREGDLLAQRLIGWAYEHIGAPHRDPLTVLRARLSEPDLTADREPIAPRATTTRPGREVSRREPRRPQSSPPSVELQVNRILSTEGPSSSALLSPPAPSGHSERSSQRSRASQKSPTTGSIPAVSVGPVPGGPAASMGATLGATASVSNETHEVPSVMALSGEREISELREVLRRVHRLVLEEPELIQNAQQIERLIEELDHPVLLAIMGPPGAGKTTFVNALIGREVIPPTTTVPILLRYGRVASGRILFHDGRIETVRFQDLSSFLEANVLELTYETVQLIEIIYPIEELTRASILDVPDLIDEPLETLIPLVADADAVLWLVGIDQAVSHWCAAAEWLNEHPMEALGIVSRIDGHDAEQVEAALSRASMTLGAGVIEVLPMSARVTLDALKSRNVAALRRSGIARLHRALRRHIFARSAAIKARAGRGRARRLIDLVLAWVSTRLELLRERSSNLQALAEQVALDRAQIRAEVEEETPPRLRMGIDGAVIACARDLSDLVLENRGEAGRVHVLRALRNRLRTAVADAVLRSREAVESRLMNVTDDYLARLDSMFPPGETNTQTQRIHTLRGLVEGFRELLIEQAFGRYEAYLQGWIDQSPLAGLFEEAEQFPTLETLGAYLRTTCLGLDRVPPIDLEGLAESLFDGVAEFCDETLAELRIATMTLEKRLRTPLLDRARISEPA